MTEYDYSEEGYKRYMENQQRISRWVNDTNSHSSEFKSPFGARSDVSTEDLVSRSLNHSPAPKSIRFRPPHEYHGSTSVSNRGGRSDSRRSKSVHRPTRHRSDSESTYYDPDGPGPMPMPSQAAVSAISPQKFSQLVDTITRSNSKQGHSRHSSHGHRPDSSSSHSRNTAARGRTQALPISGSTHPRNVARSSSLPRPFPYIDSVVLAHDHGHPHHSSTSNSHHHHHNDGHHRHHHSHHHHHHHHRPRSRSTGPSISHSHSKGSGTTYEISSPTYIAPALGNNRPLIVPFRHRPGERGYYAPNEGMPSPGYTIIPQTGTMVKVVVSSGV
ncbi:hypothetical protein L218DRAFT_83478 [Marasmius fiardii PR-910]|nr:hypothetical protein L218DRAFT_83478 [Marasmius fiardii PR-910]